MKIRKAPKRYRTKWKWWISAVPTKMKMPRNKIDPKMPRNRTRSLAAAGTLKYAKMTRNTNRLSTESAYSSRYPARNCSDGSEPNCTRKSSTRTMASPTHRPTQASAWRVRTSCDLRWKTTKSSRSAATTKTEKPIHRVGVPMSGEPRF